MSIEPGQALLHYRVVDKLGEGGMGVVWRATDTTLDREVAIKVLPQAFAADEDRVARFEREARLLASLNHPNVAGIHGIHEADGIRFLVMELVAGEDLSRRLGRGRPATSETLQIARDVARGLEAAHEQGVIHRDLKPGNVKLTPDGKAKVLDFGLAKSSVPTGSASGDPSASPTMTSAGTVAGLILGTASYMSPEQAAGQPIDRRTDIWSFGVVLAEMLTGRRMFEGETVSHTLADVLRSDIDLSDLPDDTPPAVRRLVERCLERDVRRRLRDIGEARIVLEDAVAGRGDSGVSTAAIPDASGPTARRSRLGSAALFALGAVVGLAAIGLPWFLAEPPEPEPTRRLLLNIPNSGNVRQGDGSSLSIAPDGSAVVTRGGAGTDDMLFLRRIDVFEAEPIGGTSSAGAPEFSPDGAWVAFIEGGRLRKVRIGGGAPIEIATVPSSVGNVGYHWAPDNYLYFPDEGGIRRVSADGGTVERVSAEDAIADAALLEPFALPEYGIVLCNSSGGPQRTPQLLAVDLETGAATDLGMSGMDPRYLPTGHLVFHQSGEIQIARFDPRERRFLGQPVPVLPGVAIDTSSMQLAISANGVVAYMPRRLDLGQSIVFVDHEGGVEPVFSSGMPFPSANDPRVSPDGSRLVVSRGTSEIWMVDLATRTPTLLTESGFYPLWSPDGREILYTSSRGKSFDLYRVPVDLSRPEERVLDVTHNMRSMDWPSEDRIVVREEIPGKGMDLNLWTDPGDPEAMTVLLDGKDDELAPHVSPDGNWMAYVSDYSGTDEVYVTSFPTPGARLRVSSNGGHSPRWSPDGRTLYFVEDRTMIAVTLETSPAARVVGRERLFEGDFVHYRWSRQYDLTPDGTRFVMIESPGIEVLEVVTNWFAEIRDIGK